MVQIMSHTQWALQSQSPLSLLAPHSLIPHPTSLCVHLSFSLLSWRMGCWFLTHCGTLMSTRMLFPHSPGDAGHSCLRLSWLLSLKSLLFPKLLSYHLTKTQKWDMYMDVHKLDNFISLFWSKENIYFSCSKKIQQIKILKIIVQMD